MSERRYDLGVRRSRHQIRDLADTEGLRRKLLEKLERAILLNARVEHQVRAFSDDFAEVIEVADLDRLEGGGRGTDILRHVLERPDIRRGFRQGEIAVDENGAMARCVVLLELDADDTWWCAWRPFQELRDRIGRFTGPWQRLGGRTTDALPTALRAWLDAGSALAEISYTEEIEEETEILAATLRLTSPIPDDIQALAEVVGGIFDGELLEQGLSGVVVLGLRGRDAERWEVVGGTLPCSLDDFVRSVASQMSAEAVVVIHDVIVKEEERTLRGFCFAVEYHGQRFERVLAVRRDARGRPIGVLRFGEFTDGPLEWLGVEPTDLLEIVPDYPGFWSYAQEIEA